MQETTQTSQKHSLDKGGKPGGVGAHQLLMGLLPLVVYWIVESQWGLKAGVIASLIFGACEVLYEVIRYGRPQWITLFSNILIVIMGGISLVFNEGIYFRLQPFVLEVVFAAILFGTSIAKKPLLVVLMKKQNLAVPQSEVFWNYMKGVNTRLGIIMLLHAFVVGYAALYLSTGMWIFIKGILFFIMFGFMLIGEFIYTRKYLVRRMQNERKEKLLRSVTVSKKN